MTAELWVVAVVDFGKRLPDLYAFNSKEAAVAEYRGAVEDADAPKPPRRVELSRAIRCETGEWWILIPHRKRFSPDIYTSAKAAEAEFARNYDGRDRIVRCKARRTRRWQR